jgi:NAD-dependent deacetylase
LLRPHIVWFGESLDLMVIARIDRFIRDSHDRRFVFLAVGTSGTVYPAAGLVDRCARAGAETVLVNLDAPGNQHSFQVILQGRSGDVLPKLIG